MLDRLFALPDQIFAAAAKLMADGQPMKAARLSQRALALAILLFAKPLRVENLVALDLERHFRRDGKGRFISIRIPGSETKSGRDIEAMLDRRLASDSPPTSRHTVHGCPAASPPPCFPARQEAPSIPPRSLATSSGWSRTRSAPSSIRTWFVI